ncbi:MAG: 30S ribosomal protein S8 [Candidatus Shapirobacteria bacterium]|nr:30S ribosomal protein S8 [Candidatus Shapirobacteria bacterium]
MVVTDPIADMLIRIKNGYLARKKLVEVRWSKIKERIATILVKEGFLKNVKLKMNGKFQIMEMELIYHGKEAALIQVKRISKSSVRIYAKAKKAPQARRGLNGITILTTSQGIMTSKEAAKKNIGGEVICQIW